MSGGIRGGEKLRARLKQIQEGLASRKRVEVGFFENATYPDGTHVAMVAATQEFGAVIDMPEREQTIYRSVDYQGNFKKDGRFVKAARSNFASDHTVAAHKTIIPARPFLRPTVEEKKGEWAQAAQAMLKHSDYDTEAALEAMGRVAAGDIQEKIKSVNAPPLARSTVKKRIQKGSKNPEKPLIDTGLMVQSVKYQVSDD